MVDEPKVVLSQAPLPDDVVEQESEPKFDVGDRVEDQHGDAGTVVEVAKIDRGGGAIETTYRISYDHGGEGWQTEAALTAEDEEPDEEPDDDEPAPAA